MPRYILIEQVGDDFFVHEVLRRVQQNGSLVLKDPKAVDGIVPAAGHYVLTFVGADGNGTEPLRLTSV